MERDPPVGGRLVRYEMDFTPDGDLKVTSQPTRPTFAAFSGKFVIRGSTSSELAACPRVGVERGARVAEVAVQRSRPVPACLSGAIRTREGGPAMPVTLESRLRQIQVFNLDHDASPPAPAAARPDGARRGRETRAPAMRPAAGR